MGRDGDTKAEVWAGPESPCTAGASRGHVVLGGGGRGEQIKEAEEGQAE